MYLCDLFVSVPDVHVQCVTHRVAHIMNANKHTPLTSVCRSLSKKYHPKRTREDEARYTQILHTTLIHTHTTHYCSSSQLLVSANVTIATCFYCYSRYSWCVAFAATLRQLSDVAVQREELAENLNTHIASELSRYTHELKTERKTVHIDIVSGP